LRLSVSVRHDTPSSAIQQDGSPDAQRGSEAAYVVNGDVSLTSLDPTDIVSVQPRRIR